MMTSLERLREAAELEAAEAQERFERVRRNYQDGRITQEDWSDQRADLVAEMEAQHGYADHLHTRHQRLDAYLKTDAINALDHAIQAISQVVRGQSRFDSPRLATARATITSLFASFTLHRHHDGYTLTPRIRLEALWVPGSSAIRDAEQTADLDLAHVLGEVQLPTPRQTDTPAAESRTKSSTPRRCNRRLSDSAPRSIGLTYPRAGFGADLKVLRSGYGVVSYRLPIPPPASFAAALHPARKSAR